MSDGWPSEPKRLLFILIAIVAAFAATSMVMTMIEIAKTT